MDPDKIVRETIGGMTIIFSIILALAGFIFFSCIGYLLITETHSSVWKFMGGFLIFCGLFILIFILGTIYLTFNGSSKK